MTKGIPPCKKIDSALKDLEDAFQGLVRINTSQVFSISVSPSPVIHFAFTVPTGVLTPVSSPSRKLLK